MSRAFEEVGNFLGKVTDVLGAVAGGFLENPLPTIASVALSTATGLPLWVTNAASTAIRGGSMEDFAINLATGYLGAELGSSINAAAFGDLPLEIAPEMASTATQDIFKTIITNASPAALSTALKGGDFENILESAVMGGVSGMIGKTIQTELGLDPRQFDDRIIGGAINSATKAILGGQDIATAIGSSLAQTTIGTALGTASAGLKTAMNELQTKTSDYDTYFGQYENLQTALAEDKDWLTDKYADLQNLTNTFEAKREDLLGAQENVQLAQAAMGVRPYGGVDLGVGNPHIVKLAENLGWSQVATDEWGGVGYAIPTGRMNYVRKINEDGELVGYDSWPETIVLENPNQVIAAVNPYITKLQNEAPQLDALGRQLAQETESYNGVKSRYENTANQLATVSSTLTNLKGDINNLISTRDQYFTDINDLLGKAVTQIGTEATDITKKIVDAAIDQIADAGGQVDETILGETGFEEAPKGSLAEYAAAAVSDAIKEPPPVEGLEDGDFGFAVEPTVTPSEPAPELQDIFPETIPQEAEGLGLPITFTPDVTKAPEIVEEAPASTAEEASTLTLEAEQPVAEAPVDLSGLEELFAPPSAMVEEPVVPEEVAPEIKQPVDLTDLEELFVPPQAVVEEPVEEAFIPQEVAPEVEQPTELSGLEEFFAPPQAVVEEPAKTEPPVDISDLEQLFAPPQSVVEEPVEETFIPQEPSADLTGLEQLMAPPQAVIEETPTVVEPEGFGFELPSDQPSGTAFVDEDGNTFVVDPQGNVYLTGVEGQDLLPSTTDFDFSELTDGQKYIDYAEQAGKDLAQAQDQQAYLDYEEQAGQDLAQAQADQAYIDYIEQAGKDLAQTQADQSYIDYIEQAGEDLAEAQQNFLDSGLTLDDLLPQPIQPGGVTPQPVIPRPVIPSPAAPRRPTVPIPALIQAQSAQQAYNSLLNQYLGQQPFIEPFYFKADPLDLEELFSGQTPFYQFDRTQKA